jgi:hypothetical protein
MELEPIKDTLKPEQKKVAALLVFFVGRPDYGHTFMAKFMPPTMDIEPTLLLFSF